MRRRLKSSLLAAVTLSLAGAASCSKPAPMKAEDVPVPPSARRGVLEGAYEVKIDRVAAEVRRDLAEKYGQTSADIYFLPPDADWASVRDFYEGRLGALGLKRDTGFPEENSGNRLAVWGREGWLGRGEAVAAAFIEDASPGGPQKFLALFRSAD